MGTEAGIQHMETEKLELYLLCKRIRSKKIRKGEKENSQRDQEQDKLEGKALEEPSVITEKDLLSD